MNFKKINFGKSSAEAESALSPDLLIDGYLDAEGLTERALHDQEFLFLGYKGSGKTALAKHLKLRADRTSQLFVNHIFLSDFPFRTFQKIVSGSSEPEARFPTAWSWIIQLLLLDSFNRDQGLRPIDRTDYEIVINALVKLCLLPARSLRDIVVTSSKRTFKVNLPFDMGIGYESTPIASEDVKFLHVLDQLKKLISTIRSSSKHIIIIDGLDDILSERVIQYQSLSALMTEAMRINADLQSNNVPAKILVLCRTDLFERLPGPNKNKIRQDYATEFDWYHDPRQPRSSQLVNLANLRTRLTIPSIRDVFNKFFPSQIDNTDIIEYLLMHTRHTPRDFLQLLSHLQKYWMSNIFTRDQILSGIRDYSVNYFLPEIKDEIVGYVSPERSDIALRIISSLGKRDFSFDELSQATDVRKQHINLDIEYICEMLYECSAIGYIDRRPSGKNHFSFKFRNRHSAFNSSKRIILHRGVWKAMNLI